MASPSPGGRTQPPHSPHEDFFFQGEPPYGEREEFAPVVGDTQITGDDLREIPSQLTARTQINSDASHNKTQTQTQRSDDVQTQHSHESNASSDTAATAATIYTPWTDITYDSTTTDRSLLNQWREQNKHLPCSPLITPVIHPTINKDAVFTTIDGAHVQPLALRPVQESRKADLELRLKSYAPTVQHFHQADPLFIDGQFPPDERAYVQGLIEGRLAAITALPPIPSERINFIQIGLCFADRQGQFLNATATGENGNLLLGPLNGITWFEFLDWPDHVQLMETALQRLIASEKFFTVKIHCYTEDTGFTFPFRPRIPRVEIYDTTLPWIKEDN